MSVKRDGNYGTMHRVLKILAWRYGAPQPQEMFVIESANLTYEKKVSLFSD